MAKLQLQETKDNKTKCKYWGKVESLVRERYGISLREYIQTGIEEDKPISFLALQLGLKRKRLYSFAKKHGLKTKKSEKPRPIKQELTDILDIIDLEIRDISCLIYRKQTDWISIENRIKQKYKAPSLSTYLLYEHQFNDKSIVDLSAELGVHYETLRDTMCELGIPLRSYKGKRNKTCQGGYEYLMRKYWNDDLTQEEIAKDRGVSRQTISNWMKKLEIPRKNPSQAHLGRHSPKKGKTYEEICGVEKAKKYKEKLSARTKGKTYEELYGTEKAEQIKDNLSQKHSGRTPWNKGLTKEDPRVAKYIFNRGKPQGMTGKHHSEETRRKMSEAHKKRQLI